MSCKTEDKYPAKYTMQQKTYKTYEPKDKQYKNMTDIQLFNKQTDNQNQNTNGQTRQENCTLSSDWAQLN